MRIGSFKVKINLLWGNPPGLPLSIYYIKRKFIQLCCGMLYSKISGIFAIMEFEVFAKHPVKA
jgi:hypothetical protein